MIKDNNKLKEHHKTLNLGTDISDWTDEQLKKGWTTPNGGNKNILKFKDIEWVKRYMTRETDGFEMYIDYTTIIPFDNGYYVSLISTLNSYGNEDEYEIGLCHDKLGLVYDTHITGDVLGSLSEEDVEDVLKQVSELPERTKEDNDRYIEWEENRYKNHERWLKESEQEYLTKQK